MSATTTGDERNQCAGFPESTYGIIEEFVGFLSLVEGKTDLDDGEWELVACRASAVHHRTHSVFECRKNISIVSQTIPSTVSSYLCFLSSRETMRVRTGMKLLNGM